MMPTSLRSVAIHVFSVVAAWRKHMMLSWLGRVPTVVQPDGSKLYTNFRSWCLQASDAELLEVISKPELERSPLAWGLWLIEHGYTWDGSDEWLGALRELERRKVLPFPTESRK